MMFSTTSLVQTLILFIFLICRVQAHIALMHPSQWGFNVTGDTFPYDNRPVTPLMNLTFDNWWFHNHLAYPPTDGQFFDLPAGKTATAELACNKGATSYFASSDGGNIIDPSDPNNPCPGSPISEFHTIGVDDVKGCSLAITYESNVTNVKPEDFTVFSVNHTCVWTRFTDFQVPANMPACPPGGCICAWFWIHSPDSGSMQNYMNGFRCNVTEATATVPLATPQVARRCGADPDHGVLDATPGNCTYGAKQPLYWFQAEQNNMFEDTYAPPFYNDLYNFRDGAQYDIFQDSYEFPLPIPSAEQTSLPVPKNLVGGIPLITNDPGEPFNSSLPLPAPADAAASSSSSNSSSDLASATPSSSQAASSAIPSTTASQEAPAATVTVITTEAIVTVTVPSISTPTDSSLAPVNSGVAPAPDPVPTPSTVSTTPQASAAAPPNPAESTIVLSRRFSSSSSREEQRSIRNLSRKEPYTQGGSEPGLWNRGYVPKPLGARNGTKKLSGRHFGKWREARGWGNGKGKRWA